ncbi:MAG: hypothetical protein KKG67_20460 [Gammaproteobacteria bacterium]|nr:hypothetical protein [Gammaproteobacteria bacterium]
MPQLPAQTAVEKITSHPITVAAVGGATALAAAVAVSPFAPLLGVIPNLVGAISQGRMEERLQKSLDALNDELEALNLRVDQPLSDDQVAFISETVAAMFATADEEKLAYLKEAAKNAALSDPESFNHGAALGRTLRDLTAPEITFIVRHHGKEVLLNNSPLEEGEPAPQTSTDDRVDLYLGTDESMVASGLIGLGILLALPRSWKASQLHWSRLASVIKDLVQ